MFRVNTKKSSDTINFLKNLFKNPAIYFLLAVLIILLFVREEYITILKFNSPILLVILPFVLILIWLYKKYSWRQDTFITSVSVLVAVLFFLIQVTKNDIDKANVLNALNNYNCNIIAQSNINLVNNNEIFNKFSLNYFLISPYFENIDFIYGRLSMGAKVVFMTSIVKMEATNGLINVVHDLNIEAVNLSAVPVAKESMIMYNNQIVENSKYIRENLCQESLFLHL